MKAPEEEEVGHYIKEWRMEAGLSQSELARQAGISPASLSMLEAGKASYSNRTLPAIAKVLGETPGTLIDKHPLQVHSDRGASDFVERVLRLLDKIAPSDRAVAYKLLQVFARDRQKGGIKPGPLHRLNIDAQYSMDRQGPD